MHRIGTLKPGDNIVLVVTASEHRDAAFEAAKFLMDYLKTSRAVVETRVGPRRHALGRSRREGRQRPRTLEETRRRVTSG